jgi:hypothetical protein
MKDHVWVTAGTVTHTFQYENISKHETPTCYFYNSDPNSYLGILFCILQ